MITAYINCRARLDLSHHIYSLIIDGALYRAPLEKSSIKRCLDFGTGTGIWAIDFADEFPECEIIGTDLSPIQPTSVPPNLRFYVDDVEADWGYREDEASIERVQAVLQSNTQADLCILANQAFDFIHGRYANL